MTNFDDFDLDLRGDCSARIDLTNDVIGDTDVITSLQFCAHNITWMTLLCSTCCTGQTSPQD